MSSRHRLFASALAFAAFALATSASAAPILIDDFSAPSKFTPPPSMKETFEVADNALNVTWADAHGAWTEAIYEKPILLPEFDDGLATSCVVSAALDAPKEIVSMSLRFIDASGEVFQWTQKFSGGASADKPLQIPVDFSQPQGHWAGNNNSIIERPMKFLGYGFVFASKDVPAGSLALRKLWIESESIERFEPAQFFDSLAKPRNDDSFLFGICAHLIRVEKPERDVQVKALAAAGAAVVRVDFAWTRIEPKPGEFVWDLYDDIVAETAKNGIEVQALLGFPPAHGLPPATRAEMEQAYRDKVPDAWKIALFGAPDIAKWENFVREVTARYKGKIRFYEIWNEPDLGFWRGTEDEYIATLRAAFKTIRAVDPDAKVMSGGFATVLNHAGRAKNPNMQERVLAEASDVFDIHAFHQHGPFSEFHPAVIGELARIRAKAAFQRPLWFNETAITSMHWGEMRQAAELLKKSAFVKSSGAIGWTWYNLRNDGNNPQDDEHNYGLLRNNMQPKPAFWAYRAVVETLGGAKPAGALALGEKIFAPVFAKNDGSGFVAVVWHENPKGVEVGEAVFSAEAKVADMLGKALQTTLRITPAAEPVYLFFASMPRVVSPCAITTPFPVEIEIGKTEKTLDSLQNWRSLVEADPNLAHEKWNGADDLSAKIRVGKDKVTVDVRDNIHSQTETPEMLWKGDSVQIALHPGFEIGAALAKDGSVMKYCWEGGLEFDVKISRLAENTLRYDFTLPPNSLKSGARFNILINDNDGALRKGFMRLAPGMGEMVIHADWPILK